MASGARAGGRAGRLCRACEGRGVRRGCGAAVRRSAIRRCGGARSGGRDEVRTVGRCGGGDARGRAVWRDGAPPGRPGLDPDRQWRHALARAFVAAPPLRWAWGPSGWSIRGFSGGCIADVVVHSDLSRRHARSGRMAGPTRRGCGTANRPRGPGGPLSAIRWARRGANDAAERGPAGEMRFGRYGDPATTPTASATAPWCAAELDRWPPPPRSPGVSPA